MLELFNSLTTAGKIKYIICFPFMCIIYILLYVFVCIGKYANKLHDNISCIMYKSIGGNDNASKFFKVKRYCRDTKNILI